MENRGDANQSRKIWIYEKFRGAFLSIFPMLFPMILWWHVLPVLLGWVWGGMQWKMSAILGASSEMFLCKLMSLFFPRPGCLLYLI